MLSFSEEQTAEISTAESEAIQMVVLAFLVGTDNIMELLDSIYSWIMGMCTTKTEQKLFE